MNKQDGNKDKEKEKKDKERDKTIHNIACIGFAIFFLYMFCKDDPGLLTKAVAFWSNLFHHFFHYFFH